jgi:HSP20 family protein
MNIVRWDPVRSLFNGSDFFPAALDPRERTGWVPAVDAFERDNRFVIRVELPGVERDDIEVRIEDGELVLSGERKRDAEFKDDNAYRRERVFGSFSRTFRLPDTLDVDKIEAKYENGVLTVEMPKSEASRPRRIKIQAA